MTHGDSVITYAPAYPYIGHPDMLDYTSSRGAVISLTRNLANEQADNGIRVNAVCPGAVRIPRARETTSAEPQANPTSQTGRPAHPREVAACFVFLAGPGSRLISGQCWHVNGGVAACFVNLAGPSSSSIPGQSWPVNGEVVGG
jgi:NAD(P)-dependent dehydrogenase (short-subunit alcohol dehydrogenase family)